MIKYVEHIFLHWKDTMSDCYPRGSEFDSLLYPRNFSGCIGSGMGSTQPPEDNWVPA